MEIDPSTHVWGASAVAAVAAVDRVVLEFGSRDDEVVFTGINEPSASLLGRLAIPDSGTAHSAH